MLNRSFLKAGHTPTLLSAFLYFDLSFMVWVILEPLGVAIAKDFNLDPAQKGFMVAVPVLAGALLRLVAGVLVDHIGPRKTGIIAQLTVLAGLASGMTLSQSAELASYVSAYAATGYGAQASYGTAAQIREAFADAE